MIDWEKEARARHLVGDGSESAGSSDVLSLISCQLGDEEMIHAAEHYLSHRPGSEFARCLLIMLQPRVAMEYCYTVYKEAKSIERKRDAIELLRAFADISTLPWVDEFLSDGDESVEFWGATIIENLAFKEQLSLNDLERYATKMKSHNNVSVRERAPQIRRFLKSQKSTT